MNDFRLIYLDIGYYRICIRSSENKDLEWIVKALEDKKIRVAIKDKSSISSEINYSRFSDNPIEFQDDKIKGADYEDIGWCVIRLLLQNGWEPVSHSEYVGENWSGVSYLFKTSEPGVTIPTRAKDHDIDIEVS